MGEVMVTNKNYEELLRQEESTGVSVAELVDRALEDFIRAESEKKAS